MRQPTMFIDAGDGYANVTGHDGDTAGLAGFTIDWGTDKLDEQPDPNVLPLPAHGPHRRTGRQRHTPRRHARADPTIPHAAMA